MLKKTLKAKDVILGGSLYFRINNKVTSEKGGPLSNNTNRSKTTFRFSPYVGKSVNPNWLLGLQFNYVYEDFKEKFMFGDYKKHSNRTEIDFFGRYIFTPQKRLNIFLKPFFRYGIFNEKEKRVISLPFSKSQLYYFRVGFDSGILYAINKKLSAVLKIGGFYFSSEKQKYNNGVHLAWYNYFQMDINLSSVAFGLEVNF